MDRIFDQIAREHEQYYAQKTNLVDQPRSMGWRDERAQTVRFKQLVRAISVNPGEFFSVADLGCGSGALVEYLERQGFSNFDYTGYDRSAEMVDLAVDQHFISTKCSFDKIDHADEMQVADYVLASGIFNLKFRTSDSDWLAYCLETIGMMFSKCDRGVAFNALTKYSDAGFMRDELYYSDPIFLFDHCKRNLSRNVALLHDYDEYDFTIIVRKT